MLSTAILAVALCGQVRAPAGGAIGSNGQFYKGGQFMPRGSFGYGFVTSFGLFGGGGFGEADFPPMPPQRPYGSRRGRRAPDARPSNSSTSSEAGLAVDQDGLARSRIEMARQLIKLDKVDQAREWLLLVVKMKANPATLAEARRLLDSLEPSPPQVVKQRGGHFAPSRRSATGPS
jgi:FimV-like protein